MIDWRNAISTLRSLSETGFGRLQGLLRLPPTRVLLKYRNARLYESLRTAHLERAHALRPASIVHLIKRYDFDEDAANGLDIIQAPRIRASWIIGSARLDVLEVNEPLMLSSLRTTTLALVTISLFHLVGRRPPRVVAYAIGNVNPFSASPGASIKAKVRRKVEHAMAFYVWSRLNRVVYGTDAARAAYHASLPRSGHLLEKSIPALPVACDCTWARRDASRIVFLGALAERKGFPLLLAAWKLVRTEQPDARLVVLGKGPFQESARRLAGVDDRVTFRSDPSRTVIHHELRQAQVLVLPSQRQPTWREQVGLPILEGLAHGCSIVATTETGIAPWLSAHGHEVIPATADARVLAAAIVEQLRARRSPDDIIGDLPGVDGRLAADDWLFSVASQRSAHVKAGESDAD